MKFSRPFSVLKSIPHIVTRCLSEVEAIQASALCQYYWESLNSKELWVYQGKSKGKPITSRIGGKWRKYPGAKASLEKLPETNEMISDRMWYRQFVTAHNGTIRFSIDKVMAV